MSEQEKVKRRPRIDRLKWARLYLSMGWPVIPTRPTKVTYLKEWTPYSSKLPTEEEIEHWWEKWPQANIGIVTGELSQLMVLDIDSSEIKGVIEKDHGPLPVTPCVKTGKGWHYYFTGRLSLHQQQGDRPKIYHSKGRKTGEEWELKGERAIVTAPPSIHKTGASYRWIIKPEEATLAPLPMWIIDRMETGKVPDIDTELEQLLQSYWKKSQRDELVLGLSGLLAKIGWPYDLARQLFERMARITEDEELKSRLEVLKQTYQRAQKGKIVAGRQKLGGLLTADDLESLERLVKEKRIPLTMRQIDEIRRWTTGGRHPKLRPAWERNRQIGEKIIADLREKGRFLEVQEQDCYWFDSREKKVLSLDSPLMHTILDKDYGINPSEKLCEWVVKALGTETHRSGEKAEVFLHSYFKRDLHQLYVCAGAGLMYQLDGEVIEELDNGSDGIFFKEQPGLVPWRADFNHTASVYKALVDDLSFDFGEGVALTPEQQRAVLWLWLRSLFFAEILPTKPILALIGEKGSGKSTCLRRIQKLFLGIHGEVSMLKDETAWAPAVTSNHLLILDNVDKPVKWLGPALDRISTGVMILIRKLWVTNVEVPYWPRCFVALTSLWPPFQESTTASRLIILRMRPLAQEKAESELNQAILDNRNGLMADLLERLNKDIQLLKKESNITIAFRLQDWAVLCEKLWQEKPGGAEKFKEIFTRLKGEQDWQILQYSPIPELLETWEPDSGRWYSVGELFQEWAELIEKEHLAVGFFKTTRGLGKHLVNSAAALTTLYGVERTKRKGKRWVYRFSSCVETREKQEGFDFRRKMDEKTTGKEGLDNNRVM